MDEFFIDIIYSERNVFEKNFPLQVQIVLSQTDSFSQLGIAQLLESNVQFPFPLSLHPVNHQADTQVRSGLSRLVSGDSSLLVRRHFS